MTSAPLKRIPLARALLLILALYLGVVVVMTLPFLFALEKASGFALDTRDRQLPEMLDRQRSLVNIEKMGRYAWIVYASESPDERRLARLAARVLATDACFDRNPLFSERIMLYYTKIKEIEELVTQGEGLAVRVAQAVSALEQRMHGHASFSAMQLAMLDALVTARTPEECEQAGKALSTHLALLPRKEAERLSEFSEALFRLNREHAAHLATLASLQQELDLSLRDFSDAVSRESTASAGEIATTIVEDNRNAVRAAVASFAILAGMTLAVAFLFRRQILRPLVEATRGLEEAGTEPYRVPPSLENSRLAEVQTIAAAAGRLSEVMRLQRDATLLLEDRVRERTAELEEAKKALEIEIELQKRAEAEKLALERQLRQSQVFEAVGLLAGGVAHDFNNIMGSIISCLYMTRQKQQLDDEVLSDLDQVQSLCKRGGDLTRRLLEVARRIPGKTEALSVERLFDEVRPLLERTLPKNIRLDTRAEPGLPPIRADKSMLVAALLNLALNARDAMPEGGDLSFHAFSSATERLPRAVLIEVRDTGVGMPPEVLERAFEPFFSTKPTGLGTGLGLSMVYGVVSEWGGEVRLRSTPGAGAVVTLALVVEEEAQSLDAASLDGRSPPQTSKQVLVVEDEEDIAAFETRILTLNGYRCLSAQNGIMALELLHRHPDDIGLLILDVNLPGCTGEQVYRIVSQLLPDIPVLFATGRADHVAELYPGVETVAKPFTDREFLEAVGNALARASSRTPAFPLSSDRRERAFGV